MPKSVEKVIQELTEGKGRSQDKAGRDEPDKDRKLNNIDPSDSTAKEQDLGGPSPEDKTHSDNQKSSDTGKDAAKKETRSRSRKADKAANKLEDIDFDDDDLLDEEDDDSENPFAKKKKGKKKGDDDDDDEDDDDDDESKDESVDVDLDVAEHVAALLTGEDLSEDFKAKATTIFEAALLDVSEQIKVQLEDRYEAKLDEEVESITETLGVKIDDYLNYVVDQWMEENELAVENALRSELAEEFIGGLKSLFEDNYIDVPSDKFDIVEGLTERVDELEEELTTQVENNIELYKAIKESSADEIFAEMAEGLADTDKERFEQLAEGIEADDEETYRSKLEVIKESYITQSTASNIQDINEATHTNTSALEEEQVLSEDSLVNAVAQSIGKSSKRFRPGSNDQSQ
jgi:hypothetical protein